MNNVLVTGLAIGKEFGACLACNIDFEWVINYPSVLIWSDKIILTTSTWDIIKKNVIPIPSDNPCLEKCLKLIFEIAEAEGLIEIKDSTAIISDNLSDNIFKVVDNDIKLLSENYSENVVKLGNDNKVPGQIFIENEEYCSPRLWIINASLLLARAWNAQVLFDTSVLKYCKYKFGLNSIKNNIKTNVFNSIFKTYVPNELTIPYYLFGKDGKCSICKDITKCKEKYLIDFENELKELIKWRNYDEIYQIKDVINDIVNKSKKSNDMLTSKDVIEEFNNRQQKITKRMKLIFPKIRRWTSITTILSIPVTVAGIATSNLLIAAAGAGVGGTSKLIDEGLNYLTSKYSWVGFLNKNVDKTQLK